MLGRIAIGGGALGAYAWRVEDPVGSYAVFYDLSNWLTGLVLTGEGATAWLRNFISMVLIDQADGFLLGMAFMALISLVLWPFRTAGRWGMAKVRGVVTHRHEGHETLHAHHAEADRKGPRHNHHMH